MKLTPQDKRFLMQAAAAVVGGAAVIYAGVHLIFRPLLTSRAADCRDLEVLQDRINEAETALRDEQTPRGEHRKLQADLEAATNNFVLRPVLGSLLMEVQNQLDPVAQRCQVQMDPCVERGRMEIPGQKQDKGLFFERYVMDVSLKGSYAALRSFVDEIERMNPYVCVAEIAIQGRRETPSVHHARFTLEWAVSGDKGAKP